MKRASAARCGAAGAGWPRSATGAARRRRRRASRRPAPAPRGRRPMVRRTTLMPARSSVTSTASSSVPRTSSRLRGLPGRGGLDRPRAARRCPVSARRRAQTIRSPRRTPATAAGPPSWTPRTSSPSRSGRPTARRSSRAARGGAMATPSRGRSAAWPLARAATRSATAASRRNGEDQSALHADRVEAEQAALEIEQRRARGAARQRRGVLDRPGDAAPARAAQTACRRSRRSRG